MNEKKGLCLYHANCMDGFGAAYAVWKRYGNEYEYRPVQYGDDIPSDVIGRNVFIVDFSFNRAILEDICNLAHFVTLIDHHKTAIQDLDDFEHPALTKVLSSDRSGAMLTWHYLFDDPTAPMLLLFIEDRDLWVFAHKKTRAVHAFLSSQEFDFNVWAQIESDFEDQDTSFNEAILSGNAILKVQEKQVQSLIKNPPKILFETVPPHNSTMIEVVNCPGFLASDVGHELAQRNLFGLTYFDMAGKRVFSLRSAQGGIDVSEIAKDYGGGGHKHAAGFSIPLVNQKVLWLPIQ
jgi:uncharacterized protein